MLSSDYRHSIDAKNRLFIPAKFREELGETFVIAQSLRGNYLKIYSLEAFEEYIRPIKELPRKESEEALRYIIGKSNTVSPDSQGRVVISANHMDFAKLSKDAVIIGCGDYAEIWSSEEYDKKEESIDMEALLSSLESRGL